MNKRSLAILLRARMRPNNNNSSKLALSPLTNEMQSNPQSNQSGSRATQHASQNRQKPQREFEHVRESMSLAISMNKTEVMDFVLNDFSEGYFSLYYENRRRLLLELAKEYDLDRTQVRGLIKQYLGVSGEEAQSPGPEDEGVLASFYRIERNLRHALKPKYEALFERLNMHPGGLKFLTILRADTLSIIAEENIASLRALDSDLKEKLGTWLSPAALELHQITWDDPASLLEKIVAYEAVHPISNLLDLKRRLGVGRRCFGYLHPAIPGEPLIFIEVALLKNVAETIQEVLWDDPPIPENEATCALFYSISSTQPGLAGINLGKFLIKRVITLVKRDMPHISTFATLSPIPGYIQWLLSKLASRSKLAEDDKSQSSADTSGSTFWENLFEPEEEKAIMDISEEFAAGKNGMEVMLNLLTSTNQEWSKSAELLSVLKTPLLRLCARSPRRRRGIDFVLAKQQRTARRQRTTVARRPSPTPTSSDGAHQRRTTNQRDQKVVGARRHLRRCSAIHNARRRERSGREREIGERERCRSGERAEERERKEKKKEERERYLLQEKKRGKALDSVANFHLQNGAMVERINWMADKSEKGLHQSAGIMVNYVYRLGNIEEYAQSYFSSGNIHASDEIRRYVEPLKKPEATAN